jgi:hypothetical protein
VGWPTPFVRVAYHGMQLEGVGGASLVAENPAVAGGAKRWGAPKLCVQVAENRGRESKLSKKLVDSSLSGPGSEQ